MAVVQRAWSPPSRSALIGYLLALALVLAAGVAWYEWLILPKARAEQRRRTAGDMRLLLEVRRASIERWVIAGFADAHTLAGFPTTMVLVHPAGSREPDPEFAKILAEFASLHSINRIFLVSTRHSVLASAPGNPDLPRALVNANAAHDRLYFVRGESGDDAIVFSVPVRGNEGYVLCVHDPRQWLQSLLSPGSVPLVGARLALVERTAGENVVMLGSPDVGFGGATPGELRVEQALPGASWFLVMTVDEKRVLGELDGAMRGQELAVLALLFALTSLVFAIVWGQRRAVETLVERGRARFALMLDHANDAILFLDGSGLIIRNNRRAEEFYGVTDGALHGRHVVRDLEAPPNSDAEAVQPAPAAVREGVYQAVHITAGGARTAVEVSARRAESEHPPVTVALVRDVQARVAAEQRVLRMNEQLRTAAAIGAVAMRESNRDTLLAESLRLAVASGPVAVAAIALRGATAGWAWANRAERAGCEGLAAVLPEPLVEQVLAEGHAVVHRHVEMGARGSWQAKCREAGVQSCAAVSVTVGGKSLGVLLLMSLEPGVFDAEALTLIENVVRDVGFALESITERQARRELEATLQALFDTGPVGIVTLDAEGRILDVNGEFLRIVGAERTALAGAGARWMDFCQCVAVDGGAPPCQSSVPFETDFRRVDGTLVAVFVGRVPVGLDGQRSLAVVIDLTLQRQTAESLRQTQLQLLQSQKMETIGRLAGGVAHDFNNLLTVIQGYTQILQAGRRQSPADAAALEQVLRAAERAAALTRQMLAFSRQQVLELRILDLGQVLTDTEKMIRRLIGEDIEIVMRLHGNLGRVKADPVQIEQVLLNLVVNARDAMPKGGQLTLELENFEAAPAFSERHPDVAPGAYVLLSVGDNGEGIEPDVLPRIFEPFFTTKETGKGTGLGLATVYGIVRQSGGTIWVESRPREGATFHVLLPRVYADDSMAAAPAARPLGRGEFVLVVEDDDMVRPITVAMLERLGYEVHAAADGAAALAFCEASTRAIDLLLSDVVMRGMSGPSLAERFRIVRPGVPVLFVSGYTHDTRTLELLSADGMPYLPKPFSLEALGNAVRRALSGPVASS